MILPLLSALVIVGIFVLILYLFFPGLKRFMKIILAFIFSLLIIRGLAVWFGLFSEFALGSWMIWLLVGLVSLSVLYLLFTLRGTRLRVLLFLIAMMGGFYMAVLFLRILGIDGIDTSDYDKPSSDIQSGSLVNLYDDIEPLRPRKGCGLPRGGGIHDGEHVYAYDVRTDGVCDAQLRVCDDGQLLGSYHFSSCPSASTEDIDYDNSFIHENKPEPTDPLIQPDHHVSNHDLWFDIYGKRIDPNNPPQIEVTGIVVEPPEPVWNVNIQPIYDCQTPWGERVQNGQFIKAYRYREGHGEHQCEVQLRLCRNGELLGQFTYPECVYRAAEEG